MIIYKAILIIVGIIVLLSVGIYAAIQVISDIDYKLQISGKRPMREYKGKEPLNEAINEGLETEKASKEILTKNEISHTL